MNVERSASSVDADSPWPGLATFTEEQSSLFYGREQEIRDLTRRTEGNALTVLFGQSGLGKSSLLNAGVFPRLRTRGYWPVAVRLDHSPGAPTPTEQIKLRVHDECARAGTWTKPGSAKPDETLWEFFHHRDDRLLGANGRSLVPVLVFDQFEELFTLGAGGGTERARAVAFMSELAELVENRPSEKLVARLEESSAEMDAFDFSRTDYRVVINLREDYLPHLENLKTIMPALMENRMRLAQMTGAQALEAVVKPGGALVTEDVARAIVEFVAGARGGSSERLAELQVEPPLLSVICRELNERRRSLGHAQITADLVTGNRREILTDFYERSVADLPQEMRAFVEDHLLTKSGFRDNLSLESALEFPGVTRPLIDTLVSRRLLHLEDRLGMQRVELTHDVLAEVIRAARDSRQQRIALEAGKERIRAAHRRVRRLGWAVAVMGIALAGLAVGAVALNRARNSARSAQQQAVEAQGRAETKEKEVQSANAALRRATYVSEMNVVQQALAEGNLGRAIATLNRHVPAAGEVDLRGFEWRYLWEQAHSTRSAVIGRFSAASYSGANIAFSPDGTLLATSNPDGAVEVRNFRTREIVRTLPGARGYGLKFSPDGRRLASAVGPPATAVLHVWNTQTWAEEIVPASIRSPFVFARGGEILVARDGDRFSTWLTSNWSKVAELPGTVAFIGSVLNGPIIASPDGKRVFYRGVGTDVSIRSWDLERNVELPSMPIPFGSVVLSFAFSRDGILAAGHNDGHVTLWDVASNKLLHTFEEHKAWAGAVEFSPDGSRLISSSADQTVRVYDPRTYAVVDRLVGHGGEIWGAAYSPDGNWLVTGGNWADPSLRVWSTARLGERAAGFQASTLLGFADAGKTLIGWQLGNGYSRYTIATGRESPILVDGVPNPTGVTRMNVRFSPDLKWVASVINGGVEVRDVQNSALLRPLLRHQNGDINEVAVSPDGRHLATIGSAEVWLWTLSDWSSRRIAEIPAGGTGINFSGNSRYLAVRSDKPGGSILVFDLETNAAPAEITGMPVSRGTAGAVPPAVVLSPDGSRVAVGSFGTNIGNNVVIADVRSPQKPLVVLRGHVAGILPVDFSPDGRTLASAGDDNFVKLWNLETGRELLTLPSLPTTSNRIMFSPDGSWLVARSTGGKVQLWHAPTLAEIDQARQAELAAAAGPAVPVARAAPEPGP